MKLQRKWLLNRKESFNCSLCWFPEAQDYQSFSAFSSSAYMKVFENKIKRRQVSPIYFEADCMAGKEPSCFFRWDWQKTKNIMEFPGLQQSASESPPVQQTPWRLCYLASKRHGSPLAPQHIPLLTKLFHCFSDQFKNTAVAVDVIDNISCWQRLAN